MENRWSGKKPTDESKCNKKTFLDKQEDIPPNYPEPRSDNAQINVFVDVDHIGDKLPKGHRYYSLFSWIRRQSFLIQQNKIPLRRQPFARNLLSCLL